jgi:hypothetical protein
MKGKAALARQLPAAASQPRQPTFQAVLLAAFRAAAPPHGTPRPEGPAGGKPVIPKTGRLYAASLEMVLWLHFFFRRFTALTAPAAPIEFHQEQTWGVQKRRWLLHQP